MGQVNRKKGKKRKYNPIATFFKVLFSIVLVFCLTAGGAAFAYYKITGGLADENTISQKPSVVDAILKKNMKLNVAVFGVDGDGTRTDVMFVVHFDSKERRTSILSLPRDTRVSLTTEIKDNIKANGRQYQSPTKLNAVHAYSGKEEGCKNAVLQIEDLLGIQIDHYVKVDLNAFRKIVDTIGGVEVDVPQDMNYEDPVQDLYIHLKAGKQLLNGDKAEQLVRFRKYPQGDVARVQVQQVFLKEFFRKVTSTDSIVKNLPDYISMLYSDVQTDVNLVDALKYVNYIKFIDTSNMTMELLPGEGRTVDGLSYFIHDPAETQEVVDKVFYGIGLESQLPENSKALSIEVANGGSTQGLAGQFGELLKAEGYNITGVSTYSGEKKDVTRIVVKTEGIGDDLKQFFASPEIVVDDSMLAVETDIMIILGDKEVWRGE